MGRSPNTRDRIPRKQARVPGTAAACIAGPSAAAGRLPGPLLAVELRLHLNLQNVAALI